MSSLKFDKLLYREASKDLSNNEAQLKVYDSTGIVSFLRVQVVESLKFLH